MTQDDGSACNHSTRIFVLLSNENVLYAVCCASEFAMQLSALYIMLCPLSSLVHTLKLDMDRLSIT